MRQLFVFVALFLGPVSNSWGKAPNQVWVMPSSDNLPAWGQVDLSKSAAVTNNGSPFTAGLPIIGSSGGACTQGAISGNTTTFATTNGTLTPGDCVEIDSNGNLVDAGNACVTSSGGTLAIANGGTGATTASAAFANLAPAPGTAGNVITSNGTSWISSASTGGGSGSSQGIELLSNPGFETGAITNGWTYSGGTASLVSSGADLLFGTKSASWQASATSQTFSSPALSIQGLSGGNCSAVIYYLYSGSGGDYTFQALTGATVTASQTLAPSTSASNPVTITFPCGASSSSTLTWQLVSNVSSPSTIYFDNAHLGSLSTYQVSQAQLLGQVKITGCSAPYNYTTPSLAAFSNSPTGCVGSVSGKASWSGGPSITFASIPAGNLILKYEGSLVSTYTSGIVAGLFQFTDGTNVANETSIIQAPTSSFLSFLVPGIQQTISYSSPQSNVTFSINGAYSGAGGYVSVTGTNTNPGVISVYYFPAASDIVYPSSNGGLSAGDITYTGMSSCPVGTIPADGSSYPTSTYPGLFAAIGYTYGGSGSNFKVPNAQGVFLRGSGSQVIGGVTHTGTEGTTQNDQVQGHIHQDSGHSHSFSLNLDTGTITQGSFGVGSSNSEFAHGDGTPNGTIQPTTVIGTGYANIGSPVNDGTNGTPRTGAETRPANISALACIRVLPATPAPVIVGSVTTTASGAWRSESLRFGGATAGTVCTSSPCTATAGTGLSSNITRNATGYYTVYFATPFSGSPICVCNALQDGVTSDVVCTANNSSTLTTPINTFVSGSLTDTEVSLICMGPR